MNVKTVQYVSASEIYEIVPEEGPGAPNLRDDFTNEFADAFSARACWGENPHSLVETGEFLECLLEEEYTLPEEHLDRVIAFVRSIPPGIFIDMET